jgi:transposase-like protein
MNPEQQTARRRRRTPAELRQLSAELKSSGMTVAEFCRSRDLSPSIVYRALRKLRKQAEAAGHGTQLLAVEVAGASRRAGRGKDLAVVLANGLRIEVPHGFDVATLQRLVSALERG